jgi:hypothetical protein
MRRALLLILNLLVSLVGVSGVAAANPADATMTVLHGLPHFTADIYVNGKLVLDGFKPKSVTDPLPLPPGVYHLAIRPVGKPPTSPPVLAKTVTLQPDGNYTVAAHLTPAGQPALSVFQNDRSRLPAGRSELVVRPLATPPAVNVEANGRTILRNVAAGAQSGTQVAAGDYSLRVLSTDRHPLVGAQRIKVSEGKAYFLYLVGSQQDGTLALMVQSFASSAKSPVSIQTGNGGLASAPSSSWLGLLILVAWLGVLFSIILLIRSPARRKA